MRVGDTIYPLERYLVLPTSTACAWAATFGAAAVISVVYFVAAWLGLVLRPEPAQMAVFWPASGIAVGILIIAGRRASLAVCMSVMVGGVAATIFGGRGLFRSALLAGCNSGEVILFSWFLSRWVGGPFAFRDVREVVGFLLAASIAAAISGAGGAAILATSVTPYLVAWETWLPSHVVGIVVVAPLLFALDQLRRHPPSRGETAEALAGLVILVLASLYACVPTRQIVAHLQLNHHNIAAAVMAGRPMPASFRDRWCKHLIQRGHLCDDFWHRPLRR